MWFERQKKELTSLNKRVESFGEQMSLEEFKQAQAKRSNDSLAEWKRKLAVVPLQMMVGCSTELVGPSGVRADK